MLGEVCKRGHLLDEDGVRIEQEGEYLRIRCRACAADDWRSFKYSMSPEEFAELRDAQHDACAICIKKFEKGRIIHVDHDHVSGAVRGLLCRGCNQGIGMLEEDVETLQRAIDYLSSHSPLASG